VGWGFHRLIGELRHTEGTELGWVVLGECGHNSTMSMRICLSVT
jgi:hypothetical protein